MAASEEACGLHQFLTEGVALFTSPSDDGNLLARSMMRLFVSFARELAIQRRRRLLPMGYTKQHRSHQECNFAKAQDERLVRLVRRKADPEAADIRSH
nr:hypothetical protein [Salmonella sp.]